MKVVLRKSPDDYRGSLDCLEIVSPRGLDYKLVDEDKLVGKWHTTQMVAHEGNLLGYLQTIESFAGKLSEQKFDPEPGVEIEWVD